MKKWRPLNLIFLLLLTCAAISRAAWASSAEVRESFLAPPDDSRIMMRWWWFGPAVTEREIERELRAMKDAGIGGVEVQPVYPLALDDPRTGIMNLPFLSPDFLSRVRFASEQARLLGLRFDLTLGSGWPYGGPSVTLADSAGNLRATATPMEAQDRSAPLPSLRAGEAVLAAYAGSQMLAIHDGRAWLPPELPTPPSLLFVISSHTGMRVKRPAVGAEGLVVDHYSNVALDHYLETVGESLLSAFPLIPPYAIFCDSLEVDGTDWTADFLPEFQKRRGYDLLPFLPALIGSALSEDTAAIRDDWGKTLSELLNDRFFAPLRAWAAAHGTRLRAQAYGSPPAILSSYLDVDLPEGEAAEGARWRELSPARWASSAGHLLGKAVISSETWTWIHSPAFMANPLDLKAEADLHFLQGINQLVGHGWPYSGDGVPYPGWSFYAAGALNDQNPWWIVMPDLARYLQRTSYLLRQGTPVDDVAIYLPNDDAWSHLRPGHVESIAAFRHRIGPDVTAEVMQAGFYPDYVDDGLLDAALQSGRYRAVILPGVERIPLDSFRKLENFARAGGLLVASRRLPSLAPGHLASAAEHAEVREISKRVFLEGGPGVFVANENPGLRRALDAALQADLEVSPPSRDLNFVHRQTEDADYYFIANTSPHDRQAQVTPRSRRRFAEWWNPLSGAVTTAGAPGKSFKLRLPPYGSILLALSDAPSGIVSGSAINDSARTKSVDLSRAWDIHFSDGKQVHAERLRPWGDFGESGFSGVAEYRKELDIPAEFLTPGDSVRLNLGEGSPAWPGIRLLIGTAAEWNSPVRDAAVVYINDQRAASLWSPPYTVEVGGLLKPGRNQIRIEVGNSAINRVAAEPRPDYRLLERRYGKRFSAEDTFWIRPQDSGLSGPISLDRYSPPTE